MPIQDIKGFIFDYDKFEQLCKERWEHIGPHQYYCAIHDIYFDPDGRPEFKHQDAEPCWACYNECVIEILS